MYSEMFAIGMDEATLRVAYLTPKQMPLLSGGGGSSVGAYMGKGIWAHQ